jgi:hypothetical protein
VTLTLAGPPCSWGIWVREPYTEKKESNCQTKKIKIWSWAPQGPDTKKNYPTHRRSEYYLNLLDCTANCRPVLSSEWERMGAWCETAASLGNRSRQLVVNVSTEAQGTADWEDSVRAVGNCRERQLAIALLPPVTRCKSPINPITNMNSIYTHHTRENTFQMCFSLKENLNILPSFNNSILMK